MTQPTLGAGLAACSSEPEWDNAGHQRSAFSEYVCDTSQDMADRTVSIQAANYAKDNGDSVDQNKALDILVSGVIGADGIRTEPMTISPDGAGTCSGWVWKWYFEKRSAEDMQDFTAERAAELGYL